MTLRVEVTISRSLRAILDNLPTGADIPSSHAFRDVLAGLEHLLPNVIRELYPECDSFDGLLPLFARKTNEREAEIFGQCVLISDQSVSTIHVRLQVDSSIDDIAWLECRLGEKRGDTMVRTPYVAQQGPSRKLASLFIDGQIDQGEWFYKVAYGERRSQNRQGDTHPR